MISHITDDRKTLTTKSVSLTHNKKKHDTTQRMNNSNNK